MRDFMRFPFPAADRDAIKASSISVEDIAYNHAPVKEQPYPQSMKLSFTMTDPAHAAPALHPLFPGELVFRVDTTAPGTLPEPATVVLSPSGYAGWQTRGTLMVIAQPSAVVKGLKEHLAGLHVVPTVLWYSGITLTEDFLLDTLVNGLKRQKVSRGGSAAAVATSHADWPKHAVCAFLRGTYRPKLRLGAAESQDDVARFAMPALTPVAAGSYQLVITAAQPVEGPQDGSVRSLDDATPDVERTDPVHARYGAVPARLLYRGARAHMLGAPAGNAVADAVLADWPAAPRYFTFRCTRTWQLQDNASIHLPRQVIRVRRASDSAVLARQRMPVHGVFHLKQDPADPQPAAPSVTVDFEGTMTWLDGAQADVWRVAGASDAVPYDLAVVPSPHIQLRLPMSEAIFAEPVDRPGGLRCTYMSMRRSLRALVDNRIAGGRLNHGRGSTSSITRRLIDDAWAAVPATSSRVRNNRPLPSLEPGQARTWLLPILEAFFPNTGPAHVVNGSSNRTQDYLLGRVAYELWQSNAAVLQGAGTRSNFSDDHVGRGGPAALVAASLASGTPADFHVDLARNAGESADAYADRIVDAMMAGLQPGAVLQFWNDFRDFEALKDRTYSSATAQSYGHSPIFKEYLPADAGIRVIDQSGVRTCNIVGVAGARRIAWAGDGQDVWIAANWGE